METEAYAGELSDLRKLRDIIRHEVLAEKLGNIYFIAGNAGKIDINGLPDKILVCPAYGVDWSQVYSKTEETVGAEW